MPVVRRDLRFLSAEGIAFSVMVGAGESYLAAFVLALGLGEVASGLVSTLPLLAGGLIQLATPAGIRWLGSRRRWSVTCATIQAASFLPLVAGAWLGRLPAWAVFAAASLYWASGMAVGPAWNAWVEQIVPRRIRNAYFGRRTSYVQLGLLAGLLAGGLVLQEAESAGRPLTGFLAIFGLAAAARFLSARLLARPSEPIPATRVEEGGFPALGLLRRFPAGAGGRLLFYMLALTTAVMISGPFFSAYLLAELELSYWKYMLLVGTALAAKVAALPLLHRPARRFGLVVPLRAAWLGIASLPFLYLVSADYVFLLVVQAFSGVAWAIHEYATFLLLFETIQARRRVAILTAFNLGNAVATIAGSLLGAWLLGSSGGGSSGYTALFATSGTLRVLCVGLLALVLDPAVPIRAIVFRTVAIRPTMGAVLRPILATVRRREPEPLREPAAPVGAPPDAGKKRI